MTALKTWYICVFTASVFSSFIKKIAWLLGDVYLPWLEWNFDCGIKDCIHRELNVFIFSSSTNTIITQTPRARLLWSVFSAYREFFLILLKAAVPDLVETDSFLTRLLMFRFLYCHINTLAIGSAAELFSNHYLQLFPHICLQVR